MVRRRLYNWLKSKASHFFGFQEEIDNLSIAASAGKEALENLHDNHQILQESHWDLIELSSSRETRLKAQIQSLNSTLKKKNLHINLQESLLKRKTI